MNIDHIKLPPVSQKFYDRLVKTFPALSPLDIDKNTDMMDIQRNAAQQEVIQYVRNAVVRDTSTEETVSLWDRIKYVFK